MSKITVGRLYSSSGAISGSIVHYNKYKDKPHLSKFYWWLYIWYFNTIHFL